MLKHKKGELISIVVIALMVVITVILVLVKGGITGAEVGLPGEELTVPEGEKNIPPTEEISVENISFGIGNESDVTENLSNDEYNQLQTGELAVQDFNIANGSQCGAVTSSINLTNNILVNGTCFILNTSHVIINGMGFNITGNTSGYGFNTSNNVNNITLRNFGGIGRFGAGIYTYGIFNLTVVNNTFYNNSIGFSLDTYGRNISILSNIFKNNNIGIVTNADASGTCANLSITNNNITNNNYGMDFTIEAVYECVYNFSFNNIYNNSINFEHGGDENSLDLRNNWWGFNDCVNITKNVTGIKNIKLDPYLNALYHSGSPTNCPTQYCGKPIFSNTVMTDHITDCSENGINVAEKNISLNCNGYTISSASGNTNYGFSIQYLSLTNVNITNCKINGFDTGIYYEAGSHTGHIANNTITNSTNLGINMKGIGAIITNNTVIYTNSSSGGGIKIDQRSSKVTNNNISHNFYAGILVDNSNIQFENNFLYNNSIGYYIMGSNNNYTGDRIINNSNGVLIDQDAQSYTNNHFKNTFFGNNTLDINLKDTLASNITCLNCSLNKDKIVTDSGATVYVRWFVDVNVTDILSNPLIANISAYNSLDDLENKSTTDTNGWGRLEMTEFYRNSETNFYLTPGRLVISRNNYTKANVTVNLVNQTYAQFNLTLTQINCGANITADTILANNLYCSGNGLTILTDNIMITGESINLTGAGTGTGLNLSGRKNVSISGITFQNFTYGIYLKNTNLSNLTRIKSVNSTIGVYSEDSYDNRFYDSFLGNNTNVSIYEVNSGQSNLELNLTLANTSIEDLNDINVSGISSVFLKWYADVNITMNITANLFLSNANVYGYFNNTNTIDDSAITASNGIARLILTELKKNSTGITYLTPHNVTAVFSYLGANITNSTSFNLTQTNNLKINLTLLLNCTCPKSELSITSNTNFCPGTYDVTRIFVQANNIIINCVDTTITSNSGHIGLLYLTGGYRNKTINDCTFTSNNNQEVILMSQSNDTSLNRVKTTGTTYGIWCTNSHRLKINNSTFSSTTGFWLEECNSGQFYNNTFNGQKGIYFREANNNTFFNNTFSNTLNAINFYPNSTNQQPFFSGNNTFYYNHFSGSGTFFRYESIANYTNFFNTSSGGYAQGNEYSDYCNKGKDLNADGYADTDSAGADDWPYSENISSKISDSVANNGGVIDYGPKITTCPASEVFLGSSGGSSSAAASAAPASAPAAAPPGFSTYEKPAEKPAEDFSTLEEIKKHLKTDEIIVKRTSEDTMQIAIKLENTGDQKMKLFPGLDQETEVPLYIVTKKTVGGEGSFFNKLSGIAYSENTIAGKLLQAEIIGAEEIVLNPGESIEKTLEIKDALIPPKQIKIKFSSFGETVTEQEIKVEPKKVLTGSALDIDTEQDLIDVYAIMVPEKNGESNQNNALTGAAVGLKDTKSNLYYLEITMTKKGSDKDAFVDWYGPYHTKPGQNFIFAQQFKYGQHFRGDYLLKTKIFRGNELVTEAEHEVKLE